MLRNRFQYEKECATVPYFFWTLESCNEGGVALCKKSQRDIGCQVANGVDYKGTANVSKTGQPCLAWNDPRIRHIQVQNARAAVAALDSGDRLSTKLVSTDSGF